MAIYHLHVKNISRSDGRSAVAAAAYRAGQTLPNEAEEGESKFGGRRDVLHTELCVPAGAPAWMQDRGRLWNAAEAAERRKDARLAKEIEFALPRELPPALWLTVARSMAALYTAAGHVVDLAIHEDGSGHNPHVHLMLTTRRIDGDGFGGKLREADGLKFVTEARAGWATIANEALAAAGAGIEIEARSHVALGIDERPGSHRGPNKSERRARRMSQGEEDHAAMKEMQEELRQADLVHPDRYPVPAPDGSLISPSRRDQAEDAMLAEMHRPADSKTDETPGDGPGAEIELPAKDWWDRLPGEATHTDPDQSPQLHQREWWHDPNIGDGPAPQDDGDRWDRYRR